MKDIPSCVKCGSEFTYEDGEMYVCPECGYEWSKVEDLEGDSLEFVVKDAHGNILQDGDSVVVIKDLKVKGASSPLKAGTKIKGIRLVDGADGHNIDCNIKGFGQMMLKSEFVKKSM